MKTIYAVAILFFECISIVVSAQSPVWQWVKNIGGDGMGQNISTDANGNIYFTGQFDSTITFGATTLTNNSLIGGDNIYVVKYNATGDVIWAKSAGGTCSISSMSMDANGNVYVTGEFDSPTITFGTTTLTNVGYENIFIAKYDSSGNVIWAKSAKAVTNSASNGLSSDVNGNIYATGYFSSPTITFGNDTLTNNSIATLPSFFIVKYDASGNVIWAKSADASSYSSGQSVSTDANGNAYATGYFFGNTIIFGSDTLSYAGTVDSSNDIFVVKYDATGNVIWAKSAGATGNAFGIGTDNHGNVYVTAASSGDTITFGSDTLTYGGNGGGFIVKYDLSGNVIWAKGMDNAVGESINTDVNGSVYITGGFYGPTVNFGGTTFTNNSLTNGENIFVAKYDSSGNVIWAESAGGTGDDVGESIITDGNGNGYIAGFFTSPTIGFGGITLTNDSGADYFFIAKLGNNITNGIVSESNSSNRVIVYPNPSNGNINFSGVRNGYTIEIYDLLGETIYTANANGVNYSMNLTGKANEIYFYRIIEDTEIIQQGKIILE